MEEKKCEVCGNQYLLTKKRKKMEETFLRLLSPEQLCEIFCKETFFRSGGTFGAVKQKGLSNEAGKRENNLRRSESAEFEKAKADKEKKEVKKEI